MSSDLFYCDRCHYYTPRLANIKRHLNRSSPCKAIYSTTDRDVLIGQLQKKDGKYGCSECDKTFSTHQARWVHKQQHCKGAQQAVEAVSIVDTLKSLQEKVKELETQTHTISQNNTSNSNNIQTNIQIHQHNQINAFGHESQDHLTHAFLNTCVRRTNKGFIQLLEKLHFDKDMQGRNANVRCPNKKDQLLQFNDGTRWKYERRNTVLNDMIDKGQGILQEHFEDNQDEIKEDISETMWQYITKWMEKMEHRDKSTLESLLTDIYILILNNSEELA